MDLRTTLYWPHVIRERAMDHEIQLISDGDGLAVIGRPADVERFLASEQLESRDLGLHRLKSLAHVGSVAAQAGAVIAENSGRWVKMTQDSADFARKYGLRESAGRNLPTGVVNGQSGQIRKIVEFSQGPGSAPALLANPAVLAGAAGIMAQVAMQQSMAEITEYLERIDAKLDEVLNAQKDAVLGRIVGSGFAIDEAMILWEARGRVDPVSWSKVQTVSTTLGEVQADIVLRLDRLARKLESEGSMAELAGTVGPAAVEVRDWLVALARCFQLLDAFALLELDRVLDDAPEELDAHRQGLKAARAKRLQVIAQSTERLLARMGDAVGRANENVLLNPMQSPAIVRAGNQISAGVHEFYVGLGIESGHEDAATRAWTDAASEAMDKALVVGGQGVEAVRGFGGEAIGQAGAVAGKVSSGLAGRVRKWRGGSED
ncbi:hypothetical protein [Kineosporia babensis]|uniref:Uncharacterized protein n=1 Tax=Kineosporia babensis TaxID=499548 RepID=A0A9X1STY1_9ACTN|nr:hypothetical protein [Kineosporia babensis]MCD5311801.1 hypothetical protein [Kineosporia babensis]